MLDTTFIDELASAAPAPGGGGASAYAGAVAAACASMVGELTVGHPKYADVEPEVLGSLGRLQVLRAKLLELVDADAEAFMPLSRAWAMPKGTPEELAARESAMQSALVPACEVPLETMQACMDVLCECEIMANKGSRLAVSDAGACAAIANGAMVAASMNVWTNVRSLADAALAESFRSKTLRLMDEGAAKSSAIIELVRSSLGAV